MFQLCSVTFLYICIGSFASEGKLVASAFCIAAVLHERPLLSTLVANNIYFGELSHHHLTTSDVDVVRGYALL